MSFDYAYPPRKAPAHAADPGQRFDARQRRPARIHHQRSRRRWPDRRSSTRQLCSWQLCSQSRGAHYSGGSMSIHLRSIFAATLLALSLNSTAVPITWEFRNIDFFDGGRISGSFVMDSETRAISNWSILSTAGTAVGTLFESDFVYTPANSVLIATFQWIALPAYTSRVLTIHPLTGGPIGGIYIVQTYLELPQYSGSTFRTGPSQGTIVPAAPVPEPSTLAMFLGGLAGIVGFARRYRQ